MRARITPNMDTFYAVILQQIGDSRSSPEEVCVGNCSGNMKQIYRRTTLPKYDFNKVTLKNQFRRADFVIASVTNVFLKIKSYYKNLFFLKIPNVLQN